MGKLTFRRVVTTLKRTLFISSLPIIGGTLFLVGSFCFWPGASHSTLNAGALCFLTGSLCYGLAPFLDFWELTHNHANLLEAPPGIEATLGSGEANQMAAMYEHLYKSHILRIQRANILIYMLGGIFFIAGSVLFFPAMEEVRQCMATAIARAIARAARSRELSSSPCSSCSAQNACARLSPPLQIIYHGGWLYITGCVLTLSGALLAMHTANELRRTALPMHFVAPQPAYCLPSWSDEKATLVSCSLYVLGNILFIIGSVFFFPRIIAIGGIAIEICAVLLFIVGSACFLTGAIVDLVVIARSHRLIRPSSAPNQIRELALASHAKRAAAAASRSAASRPAGARAQPIVRQYKAMAEEPSSPAARPTPGRAAACGSGSGGGLELHSPGGGAQHAQSASGAGAASATPSSAMGTVLRSPYGTPSATETV